VIQKWAEEIIHRERTRERMWKDPQDYKSTKISHKDTGTQSKVMFVQGARLFTLLI
jgi:hypothetical protein